MIRKAALALAGVCIAAPAIPETAIPVPFFISQEAIPFIACVKKEGVGGWTGTGVRIADNEIISARHVTDGAATCSANKAYLISAVRFQGDFAENVGAFPLGLRMIVSCAGIKEGGDYLAVGYAFGGPLAVEKLIGTSFKRDGFARMKGRVYPGMSGGPVIDSEGRIVAIINQKFEDFSHANVTPLSETPLCA